MWKEVPPYISNLWNGPEARTEPVANGRTALMQAVFRALDVDGDCRLSKDEMKDFVTLNGYNGNESTWSEKCVVMHRVGQSLSPRIRC